MTMDEHLLFLEEAIKEAELAAAIGEVPIGAVIVKDGKILAKAYNTRNKSQIATNHAEVLAIKKACKKFSYSILFINNLLSLDLILSKKEYSSLGGENTPNTLYN